MREITLRLTAEQRRFLDLVLNDPDATDIGYGGARGGNKTATGCIAMLICCMMWPGSDGLCLRKTEKATVRNLKDEVIKWAKALGLKPGADIVWGEQRKTFTLYNGSTIELGSVWTSESYQKLIGLQYTWIWWEEAVQHTREDIAIVNGSCRTDIPGCIAKKWYTTNPGGAGHMTLYEDFVNDETRQEGYRWVKSTIMNALPTLVNDPGYLKRITKGLPDYKVKQWVEGDWLAMAGQYFDLHPDTLCEANDPMSIIGKYANRFDSPGGIPYWATWYAGVDYGDDAPFSVTFAAVWKDPMDMTDHIHFVSEIYQSKLDLDDQAVLTLQREEDLGKIYRINNKVMYYGDPQIAAKIPSVSSATDRTVKQLWARYGWYVTPSSRILRASGWQQMRMLMKDRVMTISPTGCPALVKELRNAAYERHDSRHSEDIAKNCSDHSLTGCSYLLRKIFHGGYAVKPVNPYAPVHGTHVSEVRTA